MISSKERDSKEPEGLSKDLPWRSFCSFGAIFSFLACSILRGADWPQFHGPAGAGIAPDAKPALKWSDTENVQWKTQLPGPGTSSPIVTGQRVVVTCWSGYGDSGSGGSRKTFERHLVCLERQTGKVLWSKSIPAEKNPDQYEQFLQEHGYASHTPVTDGENIYVYFGKGGAMAFDMSGRQLWQTNLGTGSNAKNWGSASSPVLYKDSLIINASEESHAIYALAKNNGKVLWKSEAAALEYVFGTPALAQHGSSTDLVIAVPDELWGLNPETGKVRWYSQTSISGNVAPSVVAGEGVVFAFGGFPRLGAVAVKLGGRGEVTKTHLAWSGKDSSYVPTPVLYEGKLFFASDAGFATCLDAATGQLIFKERLPGASASGPGGKPVYASAVLANGNVYAVTRWNGTFVFAAKGEFELVAHNRLASDKSQFNATPAIVDRQIFLRSDRFLYCIGAVEAEVNRKAQNKQT